MLARQHYQLASWRQKESILNYRRFFDVDELIAVRVEEIEIEREFILLFDDLKAELILGEGAGFDRFPQVAAMEVGVGAGNLHCFVPDQRMRAGDRRPVELDEHRFAFGIDHAVAVHAEALHHPVAARNGAIGHGPQHHVHRLRRQRGRGR